MERKVSIITPTHNLKYINDLRDSILGQSYENWEWIVVVNGEARSALHGGVASGCALAMTEDARVRVVEYEGETDSVGKLKRYACSLATGEVIVEADHDDILLPDCIEKLVKAFKEEGVGFVYSDNAKLLQDAVFTPYLRELGWQHSFFEWKGKRLHVMLCQPLYPGRLGYIWFAPDHVRAWRKDVYDSIGGHNEDLRFCDDQDLMHRLYLVTRFKYIPEVLYLYRISGDNTWRKNDDEIQNLNMDLYDRNINSLADRFAEINGLEVIDLDDSAGREIKIDCADGGAGVVYAYGIINNAEDKDGLMREIHRVLAPGGMLISESMVNEHFNEGFFKRYTEEGMARRTGNGCLFRRCRQWRRMNIVVGHYERIASPASRDRNDQKVEGIASPAARNDVDIK